MSTWAYMSECARARDRVWGRECDEMGLRVGMSTWAYMSECARARDRVWGRECDEMGLRVGMSTWVHMSECACARYQTSEKNHFKDCFVVISEILFFSLVFQNSV
jgi:DUF971 family protein